MAVFVASNVIGGGGNLNRRTTDKILRTGFQIITKGARVIFGFSTVKYTYTHTHIFHGSIHVSQRQQNVEQVTNTQTYTIYIV